MKRTKRTAPDDALQKLLDAADKRFGVGTLIQMNSKEVPALEVFSTGSLALDIALGTRGLPYGRVIEIYGPESSGKTTMTLHAVAQVQAEGRRAAFIDAEHAIDMHYAMKLGVDPDQLLLSQPDCGEDALDLAEMMAKSGQFGLIVIDSVAALTPRAEIDGEMGDAQVGLQARLMGKALRKLTAAVNQSGTTLIFINQMRQKIGVMFGSSETTTGGNALKYYASVRLDIRRIKTLKTGDKNEAVANKTRVRVVKNKLAPPFKEAHFDIAFGRGVCVAGEALDLGVEHGVVEKSGGWYAWDGERLGNGRETCRAALLEAPERLERLRQAVLVAALAAAPAAGPATTTEAA